MKKALILLAVLISTIVLVACGPKAKEARAEVTQTISSATLTFKIKIVDPDSEVTGPFTINLKGGNVDKEVVENEIFIVQKEFKFENLAASTKYTLTVTGKKDDKNVQLFKKEYQTEALGKTDDNPILINSEEEFLAITDSEKHYKQTKDLDFKNKSIAPLFKSSNGFKGSYHGGGFTIKNINMVDAAHVENIYLSVFGYINTGAIKNLVFDNITIDNSAKPVQNSSYISIVASKTASTTAVLDNITVTNSKLVIKHNQRLVSDKLERSTISRNLHAGIILGSGYGEVTNIKVTNSKIDVDMPEVNIGISTASSLYIGGLVGVIEQDRGIKSDNLYADVDIDLNIRGTQKENKGGLIYIGGLFGAHLGNSRVSTPASTGWIAKGTIDINYQTFVDAAEEKPNYQGVSTFRIGGLIGQSNVSLDQAYAKVDLKFTGNRIKEDGFDIATTVGFTMNIAKRIVSNGSVEVVASEVAEDKVLSASLYGIKKTWTGLNKDVKTIQSLVKVNQKVYENLHEVITVETIGTVIDATWILENI